jgi:hypothetical protein
MYFRERARVELSTSLFHDDQVKTIDAAIEKAKATSGTSVDSAALELICLDYVGGQTLQERLAVLGPEALAKTFADVLNAISKDAATAVIKSIYQNVTGPWRRAFCRPDRCAPGPQGSGWHRHAPPRRSLPFEVRPMEPASS